jgi:hypothetical protein
MHDDMPDGWHQVLWADPRRAEVRPVCPCGSPGRGARVARHCDQTIVIVGGAAVCRGHHIVRAGVQEQFVGGMSERAKVHEMLGEAPTHGDVGCLGSGNGRRVARDRILRAMRLLVHRTNATGWVVDVPNVRSAFIYLAPVHISFTYLRVSILGHETGWHWRLNC